MRKELFLGLSLAAATLVLVLVGGWLDLEVAATALLGVTVGAVVGLVPDRTAGTRIAGFAAGIAVAWIGYFVRAGLMPDTEAGRAVSFALVVLVALGVTLAAVGRVPFWAVLLGAGAFAGAFEPIYEVAPPLVLENSISTATTLLLTVAIGFLAVSWFGPEQESDHAPTQEPTDTESPRTHQDDDTVALNSMMGTTR